MSTISPFKGIPNSWDFLPYNELFYDSVRLKTEERYGKHATLVDLSYAMNTFGNVKFFEWFPDLYKSKEELLSNEDEQIKAYWQTTFPTINDNEFGDYLHALTHIRSLSAHTNMGEAMLIPDNFYNIGVNFPIFTTTNKELKLEDCSQSPYETFKLGSLPIKPEKLFILNIRACSWTHNRRVKGMYKDHVGLADFPEENVSDKFLRKPKNPFEERLAYNTVRAIYMDEKFKALGSSKVSFIHTPVNISSKESYLLAYTDKEEGHWIHKISTIIKSNNSEQALQEIVNTTGGHSSFAKFLASNTIKELKLK